MRRAALAVYLIVGVGAAAAAAQPDNIVGSVRVHGNYRTPDAEVVRLAGVTIGQPLPPGGTAAVEARLRKSGQFVDVEVTTRFRTLDEAGEIALLVVVQEFPSSVIGEPVIGLPKLPRPPNPLRRLGNAAMFSPILDWVDGYGATYGARASFVHVLGKEGRLSIPASWGGRRQLALEAEKNFPTGVVGRVAAAASWSRRENPAYDVGDERKEISGDVLVPIKRRHLNLGLSGGWTDVAFAGLDETFTTYGARLVLDTRANPAFPRNAIYASAGWRVLDPEWGPRINRYRYDAQAYVGLFGTSVLALRGVSETADARLPVYERALAGGMSVLRGFRAGAFTGDNLTAGSVELRLPSHSAMRLGNHGFTLFGDAAAAYDHGTKLADATWHYGVGVGWYLRAPMVSLNVDVAYGIDRGARAHVAAGFKF